MSVAGSSVVVSESLKLLGVTFDGTMSFDKHVSSVVRACNFHMSGLRHFRSLVSDEVAHRITCSIVSSRLDYCNSLLLNCSNRNLDKLQRMQNNLAHVICNSSHLTPAEPLLRSLHWLSVCQRINYKLANLCYLAISRHQPVYLAPLIRPHSHSHSLRSSTQSLVSVPPHNIDIAARCFSVTAPRLWNSLPLSCRTVPSVNIFKNRLKTFLFSL